VLILLGTLATPLVISWGGQDHFRLPKQLLLIALAIICTAVAAMGLVLRKLEWPVDLRLPLAMAAAGLAWGVVSGIASTNRALSIQALLWGASVAALFLVMAFALRGASVTMLAAALFIPGLANASLLLLQAFEIWNPWTFDAGIPRRLMRNALLGNPNDVGAYLGVLTLFAIALLLTTKQWPYALVAAMTGAALVATETLTAIVALSAGLIVMLIIRMPRIGVAVGVIAPPLALTALLLYPATGVRVRALERSARAGMWGEVMSARLPAFVAAWEMFRDHPLLGVGPGCFKFHYMSYYAEIERRYPRLLVNAPKGTIFVQTHNDQLQLLAEIGLPGYLLVIAGIGVLAMRAFRRSRGVARLLAIPLATLVFVMMLASFSMQLAAPVWACIVLGGGCLAWSDSDVA
jgi:O-antigen ligase